MEIEHRLIHPRCPNENAEIEKYHKSIGYITPYAKYTGKAEKIFSERQKKLKRAKNRRIKENYKFIKADNNKQKAA